MKLGVRVLLAGGLASLAVLAGEAVVFEDSFREGLAAGWAWIREEPGAWRVRDGALELRVLPGNLWGAANDARNLLVRDAPPVEGGELEITAKIENQPTGQYEQVNLAWYYDDSHMVKLGREVVDGAVCVVMGREERDQTRTLARPPVAGGWYRLRLVVSGHQIRGQYWDEGASRWTDAGVCELPAPPGGRPKISLHAYNGFADREHWARITEFKVVRRTK
jgi:regulation of enolase protein 1 (concanavalin A-like superfamily)